MKQEEIWKPIKGYEGYYEISNNARVKSIERYVRQGNHMRYIPEKIKKTHNNRAGYPCVTLCKNRISREKRLHRLLMEAFVPNPDNKSQIDHINTDITDCRLENLRWVTPKENCNNPLTLLHNQQNTYTEERTAKINKKRRELGIIKRVYQYTKDGQYVGTYDSIREAWLKTGIHASQIRVSLDDNTLSAKGFMWTTKPINGVRYTPRIHPSSKPIIHYDIHGNFLGEYQSIAVASKMTGFTQTAIYRSAMKLFKNPRKYLFRYKGDPL